MTLKQSIRTSALATIGLAGGAGGAVLFGQAGQPARPAPARAALFTDAQAANGKVLYDKTCAGCHGPALSGGTAPPLTGPAFEASWRDPRVTLDDLFFVQRTTMPPRQALALTQEEHASVFAYILKANGYASGASALSVTSVELQLQRLQVTATPPALPRSAPPSAEYPRSSTRGWLRSSPRGIA